MYLQRVGRIAIGIARLARRGIVCRAFGFSQRSASSCHLARYLVQRGPTKTRALPSSCFTSFPLGVFGLSI